MKLSRPQTAGSGPGEPEGGAAAGADAASSAWQRLRYRRAARVQVAAAEPVQSVHRPGRSSRGPVDQHILAVLTPCDACADGQSGYDDKEK